MYEITCPYCRHNNFFMEVDGAINRYVPVECEHCKRIYYYLQRSWFDPFYDNSNVEVHKEQWILNRKSKLKEVGSMEDKKGKIVAYIYEPQWDIYKKFGGREYAEKVIKGMFNVGKTN